MFMHERINEEAIEIRDDSVHVSLGVIVRNDVRSKLNDAELLESGVTVAGNSNGVELRGKVLNEVQV